MADGKRPEDTDKFVKNLTGQMDGPDPEEVEAELLKPPPTIPTCEHCSEPLDKPPGTITQHRFLQINEPKKSK